MEGALISAVAKDLGSAVAKELGSAVWAELGLAWGVDEDISTLQRRMSTINAVLGEAETRAVDDGALRKWLRDLKDAAFDAEDVLDEIQTDAALQDGKEEKVLCCLCSIFSTLLYRIKTARNIKHIGKRFEEVAADRRNFHLPQRATVAAGREEISCPPVDEIFGRNEDKEKVMQWLTRVDDDRDVSVYPIVGLGGLGKTTLAKMVYNDDRSVKHFEKRMWVCVGEDFVLTAIAKALLEQGTGEPCAFSDLEAMHRRIREEVTNKRYLLVLDDVWSDDGSKWEILKGMLTGGAHGSKIVVTTRIDTVARIMGTTDIAHKLKGLTDDDCWLLFKQRAFGPRRAEESPQLVKIGREIVERCGGLPLAAKSLGGLMATKNEEGEWLAIKNSDFWNLDGGAEGILPALQLSYDHLSPQLKRCFTYCSVFPKEYKIKKSRLIQLWMSQGFIQSDRGMNLEDIGTQYFNTLLNRSFFQDEEEDQFGNIKSCKMHDLVHDLSCFVARDESSIVKLDEKISLPQGCRYSSVISREGSSSSIVEIAGEANKLRSFFLLLEGADIDDPKFPKEVSKLTRLRALHLDCVSKGNSVISVLSELKHLRFLELSCLEVEALPDSITDLRNLQTLNLGRCRELKELPKSMTGMSNLRHLDTRGCRDLAGMPRGIGRLTNLQTLSLFRVGREERHASIAELQHLTQIRGELSIEGLHNVKDPKDAIEASLSFKSGLLSLELIWGSDDGEASAASCIDCDVMENLQPHHNLKGLRIGNYGGSGFPNWFANIHSSLPNLVYLCLLSLPNCEENLPPLGLLPSLKELYLLGMRALKKVGKELYGESASASALPSFPSLKRLSLWEADNLEEWSVPERGAFPSLEDLEIWGCPKLTKMGNMESVRGRELDDLQNQPPPSFISLRHLSIYGCDGLAELPEWLSGAVSLQSLYLRSCDNIRMLPDGIQHLPGLEYLTIYRCPHLKQRCESETGEDWFKISHLPHVTIED